MRNYYASDKKRREDAKRKKKEEKRLSRLKRSTSDSPETKNESAPAPNPTDPTQDPLN